jgi:hypothetical protein
MPSPPVDDEINHHILPESPLEGEGELHRTRYGVDVVAVDMEDRGGDEPERRKGSDGKKRRRRETHLARSVA